MFSQWKQSGIQRWCSYGVHVLTFVHFRSQRVSNPVRILRMRNRCLFSGEKGVDLGHFMGLRVCSACARWRAAGWRRRGTSSATVSRTQQSLSQKIRLCSFPEFIHLFSTRFFLAVGTLSLLFKFPCVSQKNIAYIRLRLDSFWARGCGCRTLSLEATSITTPHTIAHTICTHGYGWATGCMGAGWWCAEAADWLYMCIVYSV